MSSPAMLAFGAALVLLLAGLGLIVFALNTRTTARPPSAAGPTPTAFLALVETPVPTAATPGAASPTARPTGGQAATPTSRAAATPRAAAASGPLGAGQPRAIRGLVGSMVSATGGNSLPALAVPTAAAPAAAQPPPAVNPPGQPFVPPPPAFNPPSYQPPAVVAPPSYQPPAQQPAP